MLLRCPVKSYSCIFLVLEVTQKPRLTINKQPPPPFPVLFIPRNAHILRPITSAQASPVPCVLLRRSKPQIYLSIIKAVMVDMVNHHLFRGIRNDSVHLPVAYPTVSSNRPRCVARPAFTHVRLPIVFVQSLEIILVNNSEQAFSEWNPPKCVPVADFTVQKKNSHADTSQQCGNPDPYLKGNNDDSRPLLKYADGAGDWPWSLLQHHSEHNRKI